MTEDFAGRSEENHGTPGGIGGKRRCFENAGNAWDEGETMVTIEGDCAVFSFYRPGAKEVCVAGEFNGWRAGDVGMVSAGDGNWVAKVPLPAGEFRFRYCADGEWFTDYAACGVEPGRFGMDSLVVMPRRSLKIGPGIQDVRTEDVCVA